MRRVGGAAIMPSSFGCERGESLVRDWAGWVPAFARTTGLFSQMRCRNSITGAAFRLLLFQEARGCWSLCNLPCTKERGRTPAAPGTTHSLQGNNCNHTE